MDGFPLIILGVHGLIWGGALLIIIYLIFRRMKIKQTETFEDRDN